MSVVDYDGIKMEKVTDNIDKIYKKMASPIEVLDTLRYELNNNQNSLSKIYNILLKFLKII